MMLRHLFFAGLILMLTACAGSHQQETEAREVASLLAEYDRVLALPASEQLTAYQQAQAAFEQSPGDLQRLHLALLLALPQAPWRDDARVLQLIESIAEAPTGEASPRRNLARVLHQIVGDRLRQLRHEQHKLEEAQQRYRSLLVEKQRQLREEQRKTEELQEKLDALRKIDSDTRRRRSMQ